MIALIRRRREWALGVRPANLALAFGICAIALVLSSPIVSFGTLSARSQLARLESGAVTPDKFDWTAMRFDFGQTGREALAELAKSSNRDIAKRASSSLASVSRYDMFEAENAAKVETAKMRVWPRDVPLPQTLREAVVEQFDCQSEALCVVVCNPGEDRALVLGQRCPDCYADSAAFELGTGKWSRVYATENAANDAWRDRKALHSALETGNLELREVKRHQLFLNGKPVGNLVD